MLNWEDIREEDIERGSKEGRKMVAIASNSRQVIRTPSQALWSFLIRLEEQASNLWIMP
jgi:hypothetical protein